MDKKYIKMCKEAVEIQEGWEPKDGDHIVNLTRVRGKLPKIDEFLDPEILLCQSPVKEWAFWLPRQEDLQEIAIAYLRKEDLKNGGNPNGWDNLFLQDAFWHWYREFEDFNFNELWLIFVMETCYSKQWNGKLWEAIK